MRVSAASASIPRRRVLDLINRRRRIPLQRSRYRHHHPGRAKSALQCVMLDKSRLHRMHFRDCPEPFNSRDLMPPRINRQHHARRDRPAIQMHRTCAARTPVANQFRPGQPQMLPKRTEQGHPRFNCKLKSLSVNLQFDRFSRRPKTLGHPSRQRFLISSRTRNPYQTRRGRNRTGTFYKRSASYSRRSRRFPLIATHFEIVGRLSTWGSDADIKTRNARPKRIIPIGTASSAILIE